MRSQFDRYQDLWDFVLPDGSRFCNWGGVRQSEELVRALRIGARDLVLELCCGGGGAMSLMKGAQVRCGIDVSLSALKIAAILRGGKEAVFVQADARKLPFPDGLFNKLLAQDGDAWLYKGKNQLMREIARVARPGALFVYQSYAENGQVPASVRLETGRLLREVGYPATEVPRADEVVGMLFRAGFKVKMFIDLWPVYAKDNRRMIGLYRRNRRAMENRFGKREGGLVGELLNWEQSLFSRRYWTGVRVIARRARGACQ